MAHEPEPMMLAASITLKALERSPYDLSAAAEISPDSQLLSAEHTTSALLATIVASEHERVAEQYTASLSLTMCAFWHASKPRTTRP